MRRRDVLSLLGGAAVSWPVGARALQVTKIARIGFLLNVHSELVAALMEGLTEAGYVEGQNTRFETRFHGAMLERVVQFANELVALKCDVIFTAGPYAIEAAMRATGTIPIVGIDLESDPVKTGWASSLGRPGGNFTGLFLDLPELGGKMVELLKEAKPTLTAVAVLWDFNVGEVQFRATEAAVRVAGATLLSLPVRQSKDFENAFERAVHERADAVAVLSSPLIFGQRAEIADLALKSRLATISLFTLFPRSGGLMAYGPNFAMMFKRAATYIDRILKGAKAGDIPIERPSRFELVINLKTAKALNLDIPWFLQQRADEVIE
jgi:putative ABC transport system substrate-binding protein